MTNKNKCELSIFKTILHYLSDVMKSTFLAVIFMLMIFAVQSYAVIIPIGIQNYIAINFTNSQNVALSANTPIPIGIGSGYTIVGFNAIAYQQYETCNLNNAEFFYANGTVVPSWLEGNIINEGSANTLCTTASSPNALAGSSNVLFWVKIGSNAPQFLPADISSPTTNTIYLGWAGNVISPANTLLNGITTGEAPQLSCNNPDNPSTGCAAGQYAKYDNGRSIFTSYDNFNGIVLNSTLWNTPVGATPILSNSIQITETAGGDSSGVETKSTYYSANYIFQTYIINGTAQNDGHDSGLGFGPGPIASFVPGTGNGWTVTWGPYSIFTGIHMGPSSGTLYSETVTILSGSSTSPNLNGGIITYPFTLSAHYLSSSSYIGVFNYNTIAPAISTTDIPPVGNAYVELGTNWGGSTSSYATFQWLKILQMPPNNVYPASTTSNAYVAVGATLSTSKSAYDFGQNITFTSNWNIGTPNYVVQYFIYNSSNDIIYNTTKFTGIASTTNTILLPSTIMPVGTYSANVVVENSAATPQIVNSTHTTFVINNPLVLNKRGADFVVPVGITNTQNIALTQNTQVMLSVNSLYYKNNESSNLDNIFYLFNNASPVYSWLEGNVLNESNNINLYQSANTLYWVKMPFIAPLAGRVILMGFAPTTINKFNNINNGESPLLSNTYGQYDNGANVFDLYAGFGGSSIPNNWTVGHTQGTFNPTLTGNYLQMIANSTGEATYVKYNNPFTTQNVISETSWKYNGTADDLGIGIYTGGINAYSGGDQPAGIGGYYAASEFFSSAVSAIDYVTVTGSAPTNYATATNQIMSSPGLYYAYSRFITTTNNANLSIATNALYPYGPGLYGNSIVQNVNYNGHPISPSNIFYIGAADGGLVSNIYLSSLRVRNMPPNNIMPKIIYSAPENTINDGFNLSGNLTLGRTLTLTAIISGGQAPYTYNYTLYNASGRLVNSHTYTTSSTTNAFSYVQQSSWGAGTFSANIIVSDASGASTTNTITYNINPQIILPARNINISSIAITNQSLEIGQSTTINAIVSGGSGNPYMGGWSFLIENSLYALNLSKTITLQHNPESVAINNNGTLAYVTNQYSESVSVIDTTTNTVINTISLSSYPYGIALSPNGKQLYVALYSAGGVSHGRAYGLLDDINTTTYAITSVRVGYGDSEIAFMPNGKFAYVSDQNSAMVSVVNTTTNQTIKNISVGSGPIGISVSPNGNYVYVANSGSDTLSIINTSTNTNVDTLGVGSYPFAIAFLPDGSTAYVTNQNSGNITVINTTNMAVLGSISVNGAPTSIAVNPMGDLLYVTNIASSGMLSVIDPIINNVVADIYAPLQSGIAISALGNKAYTLNWLNNGYTNLIQNLPETNLQTLPQSNTNNAIMSVTIHPLSRSKLIVTFNNVNYTISTNSTAIYGTWEVYGYAVDNKTIPYTYNSNMTTFLQNVNILPSVGITTLTPSNALMDAGELQTINAYISGGISPYTYNYIVYSPTGSIVANTIYTGISQTSNTYTFNPGVALGTYRVELTVNDSKGIGVKRNTTFIQNSQLIAGNIRPNNPKIDSGKSVTLSANVLSSNAGTAPYTYQWYVTSSGNPSCSNTYLIPSQNNQSLTISPTSNQVYTYQIADNATTPTYACSSINNVLVYSALLSPTLHASLANLDQQNTQILSASVTGGNAPYTYNFTLYNASGSEVYTISNANMLTTNTISYIQQSSWGAGTFSANVIIHDNLSSNASATTTYHVSRGLVINTFGAQNSIINPQYTQVLSTSISGGVSPYTYNYLVYNALGGILESSLYTNASTSNTFNFVLTPNSLWPAGSYSANVYVSDSSASSSIKDASTSFVVCPGVTFIGALSNATLDINQMQTLSVNVIGCVSPYTYNYTVYNPSHQLVYNSLFTTSSITNSITVIANSIGTWTINAIVSDTEPKSFQRTFIYNVSQSPSVTLSPSSNQILDRAQSMLLSANAYNGVLPYTYAWYGSNSTVSCTPIDVIPNANAHIYSLNSISSYTHYAVGIQDSATTPSSSCSNFLSVQINPQFQINSISPSSSVYDLGTNVIFNGTWTGGSPNYIANWSIYRFGFYDTNRQYNAIATTTNQLFISANTLGMGIYNILLNVTDSPTFPQTLRSASAILTINSKLAQPTLTLNTIVVNLSSSVLANVHISGGSAPYLYDYVLTNASNTILYNSGFVNSNSLVYQSSQIGLMQLKVYVKDSAAIPYEYNTTQNFLVRPSSQFTTNIMHSGSSGTPTGTYHILLSDNIQSSQQSSKPVFNVYIYNTATDVLEYQYQYYQNQLPANITYPAYDNLKLNLACSFILAVDNYTYTNQVYGLGSIPCNQNYSTVEGQYQAIYSVESITTTTSITTISTTTTTIPLQQNITTSKNVTIHINNNTITTNTTKGTNKTTINETTPIHVVGATLNIVNHSANNLSVIVVNVSASLQKSIPALERISAYNISIIGNIQNIRGPLLNFSLNYSCNYNSNTIQPYILQNGTWVKAQNYTIHSNDCSVSLPIARNSTVALFFTQAGAPPKTITQSQGNTLFEYLIGVLAVAVVMLALYIIFLYKKHPWGRNYKTKRK